MNMNIFSALTLTAILFLNSANLIEIFGRLARSLATGTTPNPINRHSRFDFN
jgi:hypothetical protein